MILGKLVQNVNDMIAVAVIFVLSFCWSSFLIMRQNVNLVINAVLGCVCALEVPIIVPVILLFYKPASDANNRLTISTNTLYILSEHYNV